MTSTYYYSNYLLAVFSEALSLLCVCCQLLPAAATAIASCLLLAIADRLIFDFDRWIGWLEKKSQRNKTKEKKNGIPNFQEARRGSSLRNVLNSSKACKYWYLFTASSNGSSISLQGSKGLFILIQQLA